MEETHECSQRGMRGGRIVVYVALWAYYARREKPRERGYTVDMKRKKERERERGRDKCSLAIWTRRGIHFRFSCEQPSFSSRVKRTR